MQVIKPLGGILLAREWTDKRVVLSSAPETKYNEVSGKSSSQVIGNPEKRPEIVPIVKPREKTPPSLLDVIVGAGSTGLFADSLTTGAANIKTRLMAQGADLGGFGVIKYRGFTHALGQILKTEGIVGLYRGFSPVALMAFPGIGTFMVTLEGAKSKFGTDPKSLFAAGILAQVAAQTFWTPSEVLKEKLMIATQIGTEDAKLGLRGLALKILQKEGVRGLYRGVGWQLATFGPFNGIGVSVSGTIQAKTKEVEAPKIAKDLVAYGIGFAIGAFVTTPADVIKTRMQIRTSNPALFDYKSSLDCAMKVVRREGVKALFSGSVSRVLWLTPRQMIFFPLVGGAIECVSGYRQGVSEGW